MNCFLIVSIQHILGPFRFSCKRTYDFLVDFLRYQNLVTPLWKTLYMSRREQRRLVLVAWWCLAQRCKLLLISAWSLSCLLNLQINNRCIAPLKFIAYWSYLISLCKWRRFVVYYFRLDLVCQQYQLLNFSLVLWLFAALVPNRLQKLKCLEAPILNFNSQIWLYTLVLELCLINLSVFLHVLQLPSYFRVVWIR